MSESSISETSSIFTTTGTFTSSSTVPGLGALSGKAIKRFGSAVVNGVDAILIRRRLAQIEDNLGQRSDGISEADALTSLYSDLLELSRPVYSLSIRTRALRVIMRKVGGMDFENLAGAMINWPLSESYRLLKTMVSCLRIEENSTKTEINHVNEAERSARLNTYYAAGHDAYETQLPYTSSEHMPKSSFPIAFLFYVAFSVASSSSPSFSRLVIELELTSFITELHSGVLNSTSNWRTHLIPAQLLLRALLEKLDPVVDSLAVARIQETINNISHLILPLLPLLRSNNILTSIRTNISQYNSLRNMTFKQKPYILLLGPGETGKTTLMKQITKACSHNPEQFYTNQERTEYIEPIMHNAHFALDRIFETLGQGWSADQWEHYMREFGDALESSLERLLAMTYHEDNATTKIPQSNELAATVYLVASYRKTFIPQYVDYFLDALPRILSKDYLPSDEDIVQCYIMTTGIYPNPINLRGRVVTLVDFGGQYSERKKWIHWFGKAGMIIFVASLSDYDEACMEDPLTNRLDDSLTVFGSLARSPWFTDVPIVLVLNKIDVFAQKLHHTSLKQYFSDYTGGEDFDSGCAYLIGKFLSRWRAARGQTDIPVYLTSAVDEKQITKTMDDICDSHLEHVLPYLEPAPVPAAPARPVVPATPALPVQIQVQVSVSTTDEEQ